MKGFVQPLQFVPLLFSAFCLLSLSCKAQTTGGVAPQNAATNAVRPVRAADGAPQNVATNAVKPIPAGGVSVLGDDTMSALRLGGSTTDSGTVTPVAVQGQTFTRALRLQTLKRPASEWSFQIGAPNAQAVKKGDVLLASLWARAVQGQAETGEARTTVILETGAPDYLKSVQEPIALSRDWKRIDVPFVAQYDSAAGAAHFWLHLGFNPQIIEIAEVSLLNFQNRVQIGDLPRLSRSYAGQEPNALWRKDALARIERIRKGNLQVRVLDKRGKPIKQAQVAIRMTRHAFPFGTAVAADEVLAKTADAERYRATIKSLFNRAVLENHMKWPFWETWGKADAQPAVTWLRQQNIEVRGHVLVWPSWRNSPTDLPALKDDKARLAKRVNDHIVEEATAFRGQLVEWDVVNEPFDNHDVTDILGRDALVGWFKLAQHTDPKPRLFLNDYPRLDGGDSNNAHLNSFFDNIAFLQQKGAPLGGIGFQGHFGSNVVPPTRVLSGLDRFSKFGLPIAITEFDINTPDETLQANYTRDFMIAAFSHPSVDSIMLWGFWEGRHWLPSAAMYRRDWTLKPNGQAWIDLVKKQWWTTVDGRTDNAGQFRARAFYGDYQVTITLPDGRKKVVTSKLLKGKDAFIVVKMS